MSVDESMVRNIAYLSRLRIDDDKVEAAKDEFNKIIDWIEDLRSVNTDGVEPLVSVNEEFITMREDKVTDGNQAEAILANAPAKEYGYFTVPKVVD